MFGGLLRGVEAEKQGLAGGKGPVEPGKMHLVLGLILSQSLVPGSHGMNTLPSLTICTPAQCLKLSIQLTTGLKPLKHEPNNLPFLELICLNFLSEAEKKKKLIHR